MDLDVLRPIQPADYLKPRRHRRLQAPLGAMRLPATRRRIVRKEPAADRPLRRSCLCGHERLARIHALYSEEAFANCGRSANFPKERLAELSKLHRNYIGGVERGERNIGLLNIVEAHALRVKPAFLVEPIP